MAAVVALLVTTDEQLHQAVQVAAAVNLAVLVDQLVKVTMVVMVLVTAIHTTAVAVAVQAKQVLTITQATVKVAMVLHG